MKIFALVITIFIIGSSIADYNSGEAPQWSSYFIGWGFLLFSEIKELIND